MPRGMAEVDHPSRRLSLGEQVSAKIAKRNVIFAQREDAAEEGWRVLKMHDRTERVTFEAPQVDPDDVSAKRSNGRRATPLDLFLEIFPQEVMDTWPDCMRESAPK